MRSIGHTQVLSPSSGGIIQQFLKRLSGSSDGAIACVHAVDRKFDKYLITQGLDKIRRESLQAVTLGAALQFLAQRHGWDRFIEQVQYRGRRLAKLAVDPATVERALQEYGNLLERECRRTSPAKAEELAPIRDHLHLLVLMALDGAFYAVREAESHAFYELFRAEVESSRLEEMLSRFLATLLDYTGAQEARLYLLDETEGVWTHEAGIPARSKALNRPAGAEARRFLSKPRSLNLPGPNPDAVLDKLWLRSFKTCWSIPLRSQGRLRGVLQFGFRKPFEWLPRELELLSAAAERCWLAAEKARLLEDLALREEQVRRLAEHMVEVEESERRRISRELHDEAGQSLLCVRLQMEMMEQELPGELHDWRQKLSEVREMTEHTIVEIRRLIAALSPAILEEMGLAPALRQLITRFRRLYPAEVRLQVPRRLDIPKKVEIIIYRLVQEILNNVAKYSMADRVNLSVETADGYLRMNVEDNGVGFDVTEAFSRRDCFGLSGLKERVALLGGSLEVKSLLKATVSGSGTENGGPQRVKGNKAGQIGVDRHGTAIWIDLPVPPRGQSGLVRTKPRTGRETAKRRWAEGKTLGS